MEPASQSALPMGLPFQLVLSGKSLPLRIVKPISTQTLSELQSKCLHGMQDSNCVLKLAEELLPADA
jgi:hypothetical protein